ncbi:hypothetical protein D3C76_1678860 [compost metagenome]
MHNLLVNIDIQIECIGIFDPLDVQVSLHLLHFLLQFNVHIALVQRQPVEM